MTKRRRRVLAWVMAVAAIAGIAGRHASLKGPAGPPIVEPDEVLRDSVMALPPAVMPAVNPSRVAIWASPALRRTNSEAVLLSSRRNRGVKTASR